LSEDLFRKDLHLSLRMFFLPYLAVSVPTLAVVYKLVPKSFYQTAFADAETNALESVRLPVSSP
jgi:hypothetical protein